MGRREWVAALTACAAACVALVPAQPLVRFSPAAWAVPAATGVPDPVAPRVAFTDGRTDLRRTIVRRTHDAADEGPSPLYEYLPGEPDAQFDPGLPPGANNGEVSGRPWPDARRLVAGPAIAAALVSTAHDRAGDVYASVVGGDKARRITCGNTAAESHPVVSSDGLRIAYASNQNGNWDIWIAEIDQATADPDDSCAGVTAAPLTTSSSDDLWPSWTPDDLHIVYSSNRAEPLGDLFALPAGLPATAELPENGLVQLTEGPDADTQPAVGLVPGPGESTPTSWALFTTTRFRKDGSLAVLRLPDPAQDQALAQQQLAEKRAVYPLWAGPDGLPAEPQVPSAEVAWSSDGAYLAYSTRRHDAYGDVAYSAVRMDGSGNLTASSDDVTDVSAIPGRAESHAAWGGSFTGREVLDEKEIVESAGIAFSAQVPPADISDAVATDGSGRRTIAAASFDDGYGALPLDEGGPAYSPDGTSILWSREDLGGGRELVKAASDGTGAVPLVYEREDGDVDVAPTWAPDGNRIAFTRYEWNNALEATEGPATWVFDITAQRTEGGRIPARRLSEVPPAGVHFVEDDPSWSPDGSFLAVSRRYAPDLSVELDVPETAAQGQTIDATGIVTNVGRVQTEPVAVILVLPRGLVAVDPPALCTQFVGAISCPVGSIPPGGVTIQGWTLRARDVGELKMSAHVLLPGDVSPASNVASETINILPAPDLASSIAIGSELSDSLTATSTIVNEGAMSAGRSELTVSLTGQLNFLGCISIDSECSEECRQTADAVTCPVGELASGSQYVVAMSVIGTASETWSISAAVDVVDGEFFADNNTSTHLQPEPEPAPPPTLGPMPALAADPPRLEPFASTPEIWVLDAASGQAAPLAAPVPCAATCTVAGRQPAWSPDGTRIVFADGGALWTATLKDEAAVDGPDLPHTAASIVAVTGFDAAGAPMPSRAVISVADEPAWSPDGAEIFFAGQPAGQPDQRGIYAVAPDGQGVRTVVQGRGPETEPAAQPWADLGIRLEAAPTGILVQQTSTLRANVENAGPSTATSVTVLVEVPSGLTVLSSPTPGCTVAAPTVTCSVDGRLEKGGSAAVDVLVRGDAEGEHISTATVTSATPDPLTQDNQSTTGNLATAGIIVGRHADLAVDLILDKSEGWTGGQPVSGRAKVTNNGPGPAVDVRLKLLVAGSIKLQPAADCPESLCLLGALTAGSSRDVAVAVSMPPPDPAAARAAEPVTQTADVVGEVSTMSSDPTPGNNVDKEAFTIRQPTVRLFPAVARPGEVVTVVVEGLPAGTAVSLAWSKGIPPDKRQLTAQNTELRRGLLLLRRDRLGERDIVVTSQSGDFGEIRAPLLVVARPVAPMPDFIGRG